MIRTLVLALVAALPLAAQDGQEKPKKPEGKRDGALFGMKFRDLTPEERRALGLKPGGAKIVSVLRGSNAEKVGLKSGDVVLRIGDAPCRNADEFMSGLWGKYDCLGLAKNGMTVDLDCTIQALDAGPKAGERAPDFTLKAQDGKSQVTLSRLIGKRPLVLVFGSYT